MSVYLFGSCPAEAAEVGITWRDVWTLGVLPLAVAVIAPFVLQLTSYGFKRRDRRREERQRLLSLIDEVDRIQERNVLLRQIFDEDIQNGGFERKMREDARYFVYMSEGKPSQEVFDTKTKDFSFMEADLLKLTIEYYDTQSLIYQCMTDLRSSLFRELSIPRKLSTLKDIVKLFDDNTEAYGRFEEKLRRQGFARAATDSKAVSPGSATG